MHLERARLVKQAFREYGIDGLACDLDETVSWTVKYWIEHLSSKYPFDEPLTPEEVIARYRYTSSVPEWNTPEIYAVMEALRHNDELHTNLPLVEGANEKLQQIHQEIIRIVVYPTVRPESVEIGTKAWLKKHGFPNAPVIPSPIDLPKEQGNKWKAEVLWHLYPQVKGIIDDNPGLPEALGADYPGVVFIYDHEDHERSSDRVIPCRTWQDVVRNVRLYFG